MITKYVVLMPVVCLVAACAIPQNVELVRGDVRDEDFEYTDRNVVAAPDTSTETPVQSDTIDVTGINEGSNEEDEQEDPVGGSAQASVGVVAPTGGGEATAPIPPTSITGFTLGQ